MSQTIITKTAKAIIVFHTVAYSMPYSQKSNEFLVFLNHYHSLLVGYHFRDDTNSTVFAHFLKQ